MYLENVDKKQPDIDFFDTGVLKVYFYNNS
jgi:hypothetical protein